MVGPRELEEPEETGISVAGAEEAPWWSAQRDWGSALLRTEAQGTPMDLEKVEESTVD